MTNDYTQSRQTRIALVNGPVILPGQVVTGKALVIDRGTILGVDDQATIDPAMPTVDVGGRYICPGLIDIHIHGALGYTYNDVHSQAFQHIAAANLQAGVTAHLATIAAAPVADLVASMEAIRTFISQPYTGSQILGIHLEGPYFFAAQAGAQDPISLRTPNDGSADDLLAYADLIKIMTFAPELPGALQLCSRLGRLGIVPAAGHSCVTDEQVWAAMQVGLKHVIHLWSAQSTVVREGPWRKPGLLEAALTFDGLTAEIIADNKHLPPTLIRLAYKCLGSQRLCVVSDATSGAGLPEDARFRMGNLEYEVHEGVGMLLDRTAFAGSTTLLNRMVHILINGVGLDLVDAVQMASLTPARVIGVDDRKGSLAPGKDADIAIFEADFRAWRTMIRGKWVDV
jgi:N-acetylglucosamine-6-phosphate deacetylase